eukprot:3008454-Prymnesium_polylepis.2
MHTFDFQDVRSLALHLITNTHKQTHTDTTRRQTRCKWAEPGTKWRHNSCKFHDPSQPCSAVWEPCRGVMRCPRLPALIRIPLRNPPCGQHV